MRLRINCPIRTAVPCTAPDVLDAQLLGGTRRWGGPVGRVGNTRPGMFGVSVKNINRKTAPEMSPRFRESEGNI